MLFFYNRQIEEEEGFVSIIKECLYVRGRWQSSCCKATIAIVTVLPSLKHSPPYWTTEAFTKALNGLAFSNYLQNKVILTSNLMMGILIGEMGLPASLMMGILTWERGFYQQLRCINASTPQAIYPRKYPCLNKQLFNKI